MGAIDKKKSPKKYEFVANITDENWQQLRPIAKSHIDAANKRLKRLENAAENEGIVSKAYFSAMESGGKFSSAGFSKDKDRMLKEWARAVGFLNMPTSTMANARKYTAKIVDMLHLNNAKDLPSKKQMQYLFRFYRMLEQHDPSRIETVGSENLVEYINEKITGELNDAINEMNKNDADFEQRIEEMFRQIEEGAAKLYEQIDHIKIDMGDSEEIPW